MAIPATVFKSKGMVRDRRKRGFDFGVFGRVLLLENEGATGGHGWRPGLRARGELCSGYDRDRCGLGKVKEGVELLTVEAIEL